MGICENPKTLITSLIKSEDLTTIFQPIFDVSNTSIIGYEALTRGPQGHPLQYPDALFNKAESIGLLSELELLCRKLAIKNFAAQQLTGYLFLNVSPQTLELASHPHGETLNLVNHYGLTPDKIVIEITETFVSKNPDSLAISLQHYRNYGFKIAIDDVGAGHSGLKQWAELRPDLVKIDKYFINDCHENIIKRELLRTLFELGRSTGVDIIAEGIEKHEEYIVLNNLGMKYAQGYLLAKPSSEPCVEFPQKLIASCASTSTEKSQPTTSAIEISSLVKEVPAIQQNKSCLDVYNIFKKDKTLQSLAVIDNASTPIGMIFRDQLIELFSTEFGHALYDKKMVETVMSDMPFMIDISTPIDEVSNRIAGHKYFDHKSEFVVTYMGKYKGLASVRSLLKKVTEEKIKHAQHANPLTMLPGNLIIQQKVNHLVEIKQSFQLAYFDLDHFKPFNDLYGYAAGDTVIQLVSDILKQSCDGNFIGHVGGDDFVGIFHNLNAEDICKLILNIFESRIVNCFDAEHIKANGYYAKSREGKKVFYPLLSLSCGIITINSADNLSHYDISQRASEAKKAAKNMPRGQLFLLATHSNST